MAHAPEQSASGVDVRNEGFNCPMIREAGGGGLGSRVGLQMRTRLSARKCLWCLREPPGFHTISRRVRHSRLGYRHAIPQEPSSQSLVGQS